jgi:hypothetical protein
VIVFFIINKIDNQIKKHIARYDIFKGRKEDKKRKKADCNARYKMKILCIAKREKG